MKAVILAGGSGTRLWPISREHKPKQFHSLLSDKTLLQETVARISFLKKSDIYIATNEAYLSAVQEQVPEIPAKNIIIEPALRDTASCIGLAATIIASRSSDNEVMCVIYADHHIKNTKELEEKLKFTANIAKKEHTINIIEVKAKYPNPNLGYVKIGQMLKSAPHGEIYNLEKFVEKPSLEKAKKMMESYKYLWNTGLYVWKIKTILDQYRKYLPKTYKTLQTIKKAIDKPNFTSVLKKNYPNCEKISIDYAIMEKIDPSLVRIIPAELGWSDIGTWEALHQELAENSDENIKKGRTMSLDTSGSLIYNYDKQLIATIGLKNIVVVSTPDALVICPKNQSHKVKELVEKLRHEKKNHLL